MDYLFCFRKFPTNYPSKMKCPHGGCKFVPTGKQQVLCLRFTDSLKFLNSLCNQLNSNEWHNFTTAHLLPKRKHLLTNMEKLTTVIFGKRLIPTKQASTFIDDRITSASTSSLSSVLSHRYRFPLHVSSNL